MCNREPTASSILVIRLGALGDVANVIRAVAALRRELPDVRVGWVVEQASRDLVEAAGVADEIIVFPRKRLGTLFAQPWTWPGGFRELAQLRRELHAYGYTYVLDFQGNFKGALIGILSGAPDRIGFARGHCREMNWLFNSIQAMPAGKRAPRAEKFAALAQVLAPDLALGATPLAVSREDAAWVDAFLDDSRGDGPLVIAHPGSSGFAAFKRWPAEGYGAVCRRLHAGRGARCVVTQGPGPGEAELAAGAAAASQDTARVAPPLSIRRLIELLRRADLVIAGDTGPLHIAALLERPLVGVYGSKDPAVYAPYGTRCEIARADVDCSPCTKRKCDDLKCIRLITVDAVTEAAEKILG